MGLPRRSAAALAAVVVTAAAGGCSLPGSGGSGGSATPVDSPTSTALQPGLERYYEQQIDWGECEGGLPGEAECGSVQVPVDWAEPDGETLQVAVLKVAAKGKRVGSLVVNPGGPGGSGVEYASYADFIVSPQIRRGFDIVGFDPRGVGRSKPVDCVDDATLDDFLGQDPTPDSPEEVAALLESTRELGRGCQERSGELLAHVSTVDAAKDMDVLRAALGEGRLTYLGKSYGTYLGATYAELFPDRVGRLVLDGVVAPDLTGEDIAIGQAAGFDRATRAWAEDCVASGCPLGDSEQEVLDGLVDQLERLDAQPVPGAGGLQLTEGWAALGVARAMYDEGLWAELTDALVALRGGDGGPLGELALQYAERTPDGRYTSNIQEVIYAVNCLDHPEEQGEAARQRVAERAAKEAPIWGRFLAWSSSACAEWPVPPVTQPHRIEAKGAAPILVVGTTRDPATPYEWAQRLDDQLADSRLLTHEGDGHTAYARQSSCVDKAVDRYLLSGTLPAEGTRC